MDMTINLSNKEKSKEKSEEKRKRRKKLSLSREVLSDMTGLIDDQMFRI